VQLILVACYRRFGSIFKVQAGCLTLEDGSDMLARNVGSKLPIPGEPEIIYLFLNSQISLGSGQSCSMPSRQRLWLAKTSQIKPSHVMANILFSHITSGMNLNQISRPEYGGSPFLRHSKKNTHTKQSH